MDTEYAVNTIREKLFALKDEKYASFSASLVPNVERERFIGVRTPQLRALAKELCGTEEARLFTAALPHYYQEENCLHGFLAERIKDEGELYAALDALTKDYLGREWEREDGAVLKIEKALIDANWGQSTDIIYQFCRQSVHAGVLLPSHGRYVGASSKPMTEYRKQPGDRLGLNWMMPNVAGKRAIRHVIYDSNYWKSFIHARLAVPLGDKGSLSLYGRIPGIHQLFAEHLTAEYRVKTQGRGRWVDEWKLKPERSDNHWLDCTAGCAVCASMLGATLPELGAARPTPKPKIKLSDRLTGTPTAEAVPRTGKLKLSELRSRKNG